MGQNEKEMDRLVAAAIRVEQAVASAHARPVTEASALDNVLTALRLAGRPIEQEWDTLALIDAAQAELAELRTIEALFISGDQGLRGGVLAAQAEHLQQWKKVAENNEASWREAEQDVRYLKEWNIGLAAKLLVLAEDMKMRRSPVFRVQRCKRLYAGYAWIAERSAFREGEVFLSKVEVASMDLFHTGFGGSPSWTVKLRLRGVVELLDAWYEAIAPGPHPAQSRAHHRFDGEGVVVRNSDRLGTLWDNDEGLREGIRWVERSLQSVLPYISLEPTEGP